MCGNMRHNSYMQHVAHAEATQACLLTTCRIDASGSARTCRAAWQARSVEHP